MEREKTISTMAPAQENKIILLKIVSKEQNEKKTHHSSEEKCPSILGLAIKFGLNFFIVAREVLCFGFVTKPVLIT